jgi:hypothetical protein
VEQVVMDIDFDHIGSEERHSYSNRTRIMAEDITAESVIKPIATSDINLQRMTIAEQSDYKVTRNHMNPDNCINSKNIYGQLPTLRNSKPCWNFAS